jgi:3-hydroxyacyl-CoA dehydrogenase
MPGEVPSETHGQSGATTSRAYLTCRLAPPESIFLALFADDSHNGDACMRIVKVGVIGAGAMGTGIAALAASAGFRVVLLDVPGEPDRDALARNALQRASKAKPSPFLNPALAGRIAIGNVEDHLERVADCDWIVEAIIEQPAPKRGLFERLERISKPSAIVSSNTSGIPIHSLVHGRTDSFRQRFLGTHFFNPPRYLHLLELIPTADTSAETMRRMRAFSERMLGKGVVVAKDVPGFIANRLGIYGLVRALRLMETFELDIDTVDALTGPLVGRPKSAIFRTADITGIDVLAHVTRGLSQTTGEDFSLPPWVQALVDGGRLGEKTGAGFYRKAKDGIHTLDWKTGEYKPQTRPALQELEYLKELPLSQRLRALATAGGVHAEYVRRLMLESSMYALAQTPHLAHDIVSVDRAMEWGYGWELGPFRQMDALGMEFLRGGGASLGIPEPALLRTARESFYRAMSSGERQLTFTGEYAPIEPVSGQIDLALVHQRTGAVESNEDAALLDLGEGVLLLESRTRMNTMRPGVMRLLDSAIARITRDGYAGLVVGNSDPRTFTAGADLVLILQQVASGDWKVLDAAVRAFQQTIASVRAAPFPVVVAPFGLTLGGGAELSLHAACVQAHAELYMGLVEVGVGLIPAGGGTKEIIFRFAEDLMPYEEADPFEAVKRAFKLISTGTTSTSAPDARRLGFLRQSDRISMNRDRLLADAKARVLELAPEHVAPPPRTMRALGREALGNLQYAVWSMRESNYITDHEVKVGNHLAYVLCGGDGPPREVTEQDILDLEREAFLALLGTKETQERIAYTLKTGKPLRN